MNLSKYPLDTTDFGKGSVITSHQLEEVTGYKKEEHCYRLEVLRIKGYIEKSLAARNLHVTISIRGFDLCILTDREAAIYNDNQIRIRINQAINSFERLLRVDASELDIQEKQTHRRNIDVNSRYIQPLYAVRTQEQITCAGYKRKTPGLALTAN